MTPAAPTGNNPAESPESANIPVSSALSAGDQEQLLRDKTDKFIKEDPKALTMIQEYHKGTRSKDDLKTLYTNKLRSLSQKDKIDLGITPSTTEGVTAFMARTGCFDDQFLYFIDKNHTLKQKARESLATECVQTADDEYDLTQSQRDALKQALMDDANESIPSLRTFLESYNLRKKRIASYLSSPREKSLNEHVTMRDIHQKLAQLPPTTPHRASILATWASMIGGIDKKDGESLADAIARLREGDGATELATNYEKFFRECPESVISSTEKGHILNFLLRRYLPYVTLDELDRVAPKKAKELTQVTADDTFSSTDAEWQEAYQGHRPDRVAQMQKDTLIDSGIPTRSLGDELKLRLLTAYGHQKRLDQVEEYWTGVPGGIARDGDYVKNFHSHYGWHPEEVSTQNTLVKKLEGALGNKLKNIEHFKRGNMMTCSIKNQEGTGMMTGYYAIDEVLSDDPEDESLVQLRFLGTNEATAGQQTGEKKVQKLSLYNGKPMFLTGPRFFDYISHSLGGDECSLDFVSGDEAIAERLKNDGVETYTQAETYQRLREIHGETVIPSLEALQAEVDELLQDDKGKKLESNDVNERKLRDGLMFAIQGDAGIDTFQIESIDETTGMIHLWDGWGSKPKKAGAVDKSRQELSFSDFINTLKQFKKSNKTVYRLPCKADKAFGIDEFNALMERESNSMEGRHRYNQRIQIKDGGLVEKGLSGGEKPHSIVKVGPKKDLQIEHIEGSHVTLRMGTFTNIDVDKKKGKINKQASFVGSGSMKMPLSWLWAYLQSNNARLESPPPKGKPYYAETKEKPMSWWNVFCHAHSFGTLLHGDLWKGPWKAFEEQHHKDHAFAGKITAALAIEKLQGTPLIGGLLFDYDWANLMIGDGSSSFNSYLEELVNKIDGMGSAHRTRLIKKWSRLHFPDPKFMAAMLASMQIFGTLYPYDEGEKDPRKGQWFWYNSITHSIGKGALQDGWPEHMPPHGNDKWPTNEDGQKIGEIEACQRLFGGFKHPLLKNLGRRFQKYAQKGHENQKDGGVGNLEERGSMEEKLHWMVEQTAEYRITEAFGGATELWLKEGYPAEITSMPYAALLFGNRENQMLPKTAESIKKQMQEEGVQMPMFAFVQSKTQGDIFRDVGITMAYTISDEAGSQLEALVKESSERRLHKGDPWVPKFKAYWRRYGAQLMNKITGMKDPLLNILINAPEAFDAMYDAMPPEKQKQYARLKNSKSEGRENIGKYHDRLKKIMDSPTHIGLHREKGFYSGDHFRFRDVFDSGFPMAWINWDAYWDQNIDENYASGTQGSTKGDGVFNEIRAFLYAIPKMANAMVHQMGIPENQKNTFVQKICENLYKKNIEPMQRLAQKKIVATNPKAEYVSMTASMFGLISVQKMTGSQDPDDIKRFADYKRKMDETVAKADVMQKNDFQRSIIYREKMATKWSEIVDKQLDVSNMSISDIYNLGEHTKGHKPPSLDIIDKTQERFEKAMIGGGNRGGQNPEKKKEEERKRAARNSAFPTIGTMTP